MVAEHKTAVVETTSAYRPPKVVNSYISSIQDDSSCNVKEFDPKADCRVTRALEEHVIRGSRLGGVNFCAYQTLNDDPSEKNPLYLRATCQEYYPISYQLECATTDLKHACLNKGGDGSVGDNFEEEHYEHYKDGIKKCDTSCHYNKLQTPILATGEGAAWIPVKLTFNGAGDVRYQAVEMGLPNDFFPQKYLAKINSREVFSSEGDKKVLESIGERAERYFGLGIEGKR